MGSPTRRITHLARTLITEGATVSLRCAAAGFLIFGAVVFWSGETLAATPGPTESAPIDQLNAHESGDGKMQVFDCEHLSRVVVRFSPQAVSLRLSNRNATLPRSVAASGERYSDGSATFWNAGSYARIEEPAGTYFCRNSPTEVGWEDARSRGIEVRAAGHEPEWSLEIDEGTGIEFVGDSGATRITTPAPPPEVDSNLGRTTYNTRTAEHTLSVLFENRLCWYQANSMASSATVTVTLDGNKVYRGCGRTLLSGVLVGTVGYRAPIAPPAGSELRVRLVRLTGSSREVVGEYKALIEGQSPIRFEIKYDQPRIYGGDTYGIEATISVNAKLRWSTRKAYPVLTRGSVGFAEVLLEAAPQAPCGRGLGQGC